MATKTTLEAELRGLMEEFVARIVATIRNASVAEVAALSVPQRSPRAGGAPSPAAEPRRTGGRRGPRAASAERDAEVAKRIVATLSNAPGPMNARALASELGVAADKLARPLKQLRDEGRIKKHGDKRATTYGVS